MDIRIGGNGVRARLLAGVAAVAVAVGMAGVAAAAPGSHPNVTARDLTPTMRTLAKPETVGNAGELADLACPSATTCIGVGEVTRGPVHEPIAQTLKDTTWTTTVLPSIAHPAGSNPVLLAISCPSAASCVATGFFQGRRPEAPFTETLSGATWTARPAPLPFADISCAAAGSCEAIELDADVVGTLHNGVWTTASLPTADHVNGISCPVAGDCTAVASNSVNNANQAVVLRLTDGVWTASTIASSDNLYLEAVDCPTTSLCEAVGLDRPTLNGPDSWLTAAITPTATSEATVTAAAGSTGTTLDGVACTSASWCLANSDGSADFVLSNGQWTQAPSALGFGAVACRGPNSCVDAAGFRQNSAGLWVSDLVPAAADPQDTTLSGVSCWAAGSCVASGSTTTLFGPSPLVENRRDAVWHPTVGSNGKVQPGELSAVSCGAARHCVAVGGKVIATTSGGGDWSFLPIATDRAVPDLSLAGISCRAALTCLLVGSSTSGTAVRPAAVLMTATTWKPAVLSVPAGDRPARFTAAACSSATACSAIGQAKGGRALIATLTRGRWTVKVLAGGSALTALACPPHGGCVAVGSEAGRDLVVSPRRGVWVSHLGSVKTTRTPATLSCPTASVCWATTSSAPYVAGDRPNLQLIMVTPTNARVVSPIIVSGAYSAESTGISCPSPTSCSIVGSALAPSGTAGTVGIFNPEN